MRNKNIKSYKKKNGTTAYKFKTYLGTDPVTGKRIETTRRGFKSVREAQRALDRLRVDYDTNGWRSSSQQPIKTFDDLYNVWFKTKKDHVKPTSLSSYYFSYKNHIKPELGSIKLEKLTPLILQNFFDKLSKKYSELGPDRNIINQMISYAVRMEIMEHNPMTKVNVPKGKAAHHEIKENFYSKDELAYFLKIVKENCEFKKYVYFRLLAYTGLRRGESLALTWSDLDIEKKTLSVNKNDICDSINKKMIITTPKNKSSVRTLSMDDKTISVLQQWHLKQAKWKMVQGFRKSDNEQLIFPNKNNDLMNPNIVSGWLRTIYGNFPQKKIRIHGFRHTHASLLFEAGASIKEVQDRLGHSDSKMTLQIYTHVMKSRKNETGARFAKYMDN